MDAEDRVPDTKLELLRYLMITIPEPPLPEADDLSASPPPPPPPVPSTPFPPT
jgi:hypothetical protein